MPLSPAAKAKRREYAKRWYKENRDRCRDRDRAYRLRKYGVTQKTVDVAFLDQGAACAICKRSDAEKWDIDHCHETGMFRGVLCPQCNKGLGLFKDDIGALRAAADYLAAQQSKAK